MQLTVVDLPDAALVAAVGRGDRTALEELYRRHVPLLYLRLSRRCADPSLVEEAIQDTFVAVWQEASTFRSDGHAVSRIGQRNYHGDTEQEREDGDPDGRSNGCKPLHMRELAGAGFDVPRWVATNDADQAEELAGRSPAGAVVKAASGLRSHVRRWTTEMRTRFDAGTAPHVVQEFIEGDEVRVHVVGESVFAARIEATVTDYRFDTTNVHYDDCTPPGEIARRCVDHARREGLPLAGFDFRVDRTGRWYCLEMNPVPSFLPYEAGTGAMIGDAVIDLLAPGSGRPHRVSPLRALQLS